MLWVGGVGVEDACDVVSSETLTNNADLI
jgi:hypothetical protein